MKLDFKKMKATHFDLQRLKRLPWTVASRAFLAICVLILAALAGGGAMYWQYVVLASPSQEETLEKSSAFRYNVYKQALEQEAKKEAKLNGLGATALPNPFIRSSAVQLPESNDQPQ